MTRILLTGGLGFIGLETLAAFVKSGFKVIISDRRSVLCSLIDRSVFSADYVRNTYSKLQLADDVINEKTTMQNLPPIDAIVHLGGLVHTMAPSERQIAENVDATRELVDAIHGTGKPFIFASSAAVYGNYGTPINAYGLSKMLCEKIVLSLPRSVALRFFNVYGTYEDHKDEMASMPWKISRAYKDSKMYDLFDGDSMRDFIHVHDVANSIVYATKLALQDAVSSVVYDVGTGDSSSFDFLDATTKAAYSSPRSFMRPVPRPLHLKDVYQTMTSAGLAVENLPKLMGLKTITLEQGVKMLKEAIS